MKSGNLNFLESSGPLQAEVQPTSEVGTPSRRGYVVPMRMMVKIKGESEVPGGGP